MLLAIPEGLTPAQVAQARAQLDAADWAGGPPVEAQAASASSGSAAIVRRISITPYFTPCIRYLSGQASSSRMPPMTIETSPIVWNTPT